MYPTLRTKEMSCASVLGIIAIIESVRIPPDGDNKASLPLSQRHWRLAFIALSIGESAKLVNGDNEIQPLLPLLHGDPANPDGSINQLILALFTLMKTAFESIKKTGLVDIFAELFSRVVDDCTIFPEMRDRFIDIVKDVCEKNSTEDGQKLLGQCPLNPRNLQGF